MIEYILNDYNLFLKLLSIDSLTSTIYFIKNLIDNKLTESQIVNMSNSLYNKGIVDRYIYYLLITIFYNGLKYFVYCSGLMYIVYLLILCTTIPFILNIILISKSFNKIMLIKENIIKKYISKMLIFIIKFVSKNFLDKDVQLKSKEILKIFNNYEHITEYFEEIIKNFLIVIIFARLKSYAPRISYKVSKMIYNYKMGYDLKNYNITTAKTTITDIIENHKWKDILNPNTQKAILYIYETSDDNKTFTKIMNNINYKFWKIVAIWTLISSFNSLWLGFIMSMTWIIYKEKSFEILVKRMVYGTIIGFLFMFSNEYLLFSIISQIGYDLIFSNLTKILVKSIVKKIKKIIKNMYELSKYKYVFMLSSLYYIILWINGTDYISNVNVLMILSMLILFDDYKKTLPFMFNIYSVLLTKFNIMHYIYCQLLCMFILFYIIDLKNITDYIISLPISYKVTKKREIIKDNIIENYITENNKNNKGNTVNNNKYIIENYCE